MPVSRLLPVALLALGSCLLIACGDRSTTETAGHGNTETADRAESMPESVVNDLPTMSGALLVDDDPPDGGDHDPLLSGVSQAELDVLLGTYGSGGLDTLVELGGSAAAVPERDTHFPIEGPRGGALFSLGADRGFFEYSHNEHWGISALYLYDASMKRREFDEMPVLNVWAEGASITLAPQRESFDEVEDGGWHFEDDHLLGYPEAGRFRLLVDGRAYTPVFDHIHVGHGQGHAHVAAHATGPHLHGLGPHRGYVVTLGAHVAHLEVVHKPHWGILATYLYDAAMQPRALGEAPILNVLCDGEPLQLTAGLDIWDGEEDGGWHFEDDALLGETGPARLRVALDGKTYTPPFTYFRHGEEPGHSHDSGGAAADER